MRRKRTHVHQSFVGFEDSLKSSNWSSDCQVCSLRFCYCYLHSTSLYSLVVSENSFLLFGVDGKGHSLICWHWSLAYLHYFSFPFDVFSSLWKQFEYRFIFELDARSLAPVYVLISLWNTHLFQAYGSCMKWGFANFCLFFLLPFFFFVTYSCVYFLVSPLLG